MTLSIDNLLQHAAELVSQQPTLAIASVFVLALSESLPVIGTVVPGTATILAEGGPAKVVEWIKRQKRPLLTDTTMRDAHQSLFATRMRTIDMLRIAPYYARMLPQLLSLECWGGATFDVAYRFLQECPWQRLRDLRTRMPNLMTQMLLRASNGVGYTNYPDNVVRSFVLRAAETGVDVFRVFDSLNWVENMRVAIDAVLESGKIAQGALDIRIIRQRLDQRHLDRLFHFHASRDKARGIDNEAG